MTDPYDEPNLGPDENDSDLLDEDADIQTIRCPECGGYIPESADRCHHCGHYVIHPLTERRFSWWWILLAGLGTLGFILLYAL